MIAETLTDDSGVKVEIHYEEDASYANPRDNDGILGAMIGDHPRYSLFDGEHDIHAPRGLDLEAECVCEGENEDCERCEGTGYYDRSLAEYFRQEYGARVVMPLFLLDHSGLSIRTGSNLMNETDERAATRSVNRFIGDGAGWDTSMVGFVFDSNETREACGCEDWDAERIEQSIDNEIREFSSYLEGDVYWIGSVDADGDQIESVGGFIGYEYAEEEAKGMLASAVEHATRENTERQFWLEREVVTI